MTYETLTIIIEKTNRVKLQDLIEVVDQLFNYTHAASDTAEYLLEKDSLLDLACSQDLFEGSMVDFHNLSVNLAREGDYFNACRILDKGLTRYAYSVDLLADFLNYGMNCGLEQRCQEIYDRLFSIKDLWNWRAYQFSIDYLKESQKNRPLVDLNELRELVDEFVEKEPDVEESYLEKAEFLRDMGTEDERDSFVSVLEFATSDACPLKRTPKCDLTLADYFYDKGGDLNKALTLIERCKRNSVEVQLSVNRDYVYLLSALCRISLFYDSLDSDIGKKVSEDSEQWQQVMKVFDDFHIAASGEMDSRVRKCKNIIRAFEKETSVPYPYDDLDY